MHPRLVFRCVAVLACLGALGAAALVADAATPYRGSSPITVTTTDDTLASGGLCSLRAAIVAANTDSPSGSCPAGSGADTIVLGPALPSPAVFLLTRTGAGENEAGTGDLDVSGVLTISGSGPGNILVDGNNSDRVFHILAGAQVTLFGLAVQHGNPGAAGEGGGILVDPTGDLSLSSVTVSGNAASGGGAIKVQGKLRASNSVVSANQGGGLKNDGGAMTLSGVQVVDNLAGFGIRNQGQGSLQFDGGSVSGHAAGGIYNATSTAVVRYVDISGNAGNGGAVNVGVTLSRLTLERCTLTANSATNGAGVFNEGIAARADIRDSRISQNTASAAGGGLFNNGIMVIEASTIDHNQARSGGGIDHFGGNLYLTNVTISGNTATDNGGAIYNRAPATLKSVTLSGNAANGLDTGGSLFNDEASLGIGNSILVTADAGGNCFNNAGFINSLGHNLDSGETCGLHGAGDLANSDPLLGSLQDNGGHTPTHELLAGSPAIDHGDNALCPATDQRGVLRPAGAACDIGAFELGLLPPPLSPRIFLPLLVRTN